MEKENELKTIHDNWLNHPMTKAAFRAIENHRQSFVKKSESGVVDSNVTDAQIRMLVMGSKTCDYIRMILQDKDKFQLTPNELNNL